MDDEVHEKRIRLLTYYENIATVKVVILNNPKA